MKFKNTKNKRIDDSKGKEHSCKLSRMREKKEEKMKRKILAALLCGTFVMLLVACGFSESDEETEKEINEEAEISKDDETVETLNEEESPAFPAEYDGCTLNVTNIDTDGEYMTVYATFTNDNEEPAYALSLFVVKAFQGDLELEDCSDINGDEDSLIQEVKDGASIDVTYKFKLDSADEDIELMACEPTAEQELLAENIYYLSENK